MFPPYRRTSCSRQPLRTLLFFCLWLLFHFPASSASPVRERFTPPSGFDELPEIEFREAARVFVSDALRFGHFEEIEELGERYRHGAARTTSGLWKSGMLYSGVSAVSEDFIEDEAGFQSLLKLHDRWIAAFPGSPMPYIARAQSIIERAFEIRGPGYASTVRPEAWPIFQQLVAEARKDLERSKAVATADPQWYASMLYVGKLQNWSREEFGALADEAVTRFPNYYPIYFEMTTYFLPKWHGDIDQLDLFARGAMQRVPHEDASAIYARIYWMASQSQFDLRVFSDSAVNWNLMKAGMDAVLRAYPDQWNINNFALFACAAGDGATTVAMMGRIQGAPLMDAWRSPKTYQACLSFSQANRI